MSEGSKSEPFDFQAATKVASEMAMHGLAGIMLAMEEFREGAAVRAHVREILARSMPPEKSRHTRIQHEEQVRLLQSLESRLEALQERALSVYGRFKEVIARTEHAREFVSVQIEALDSSARPKSARDRLPFALPNIKLTMAVFQHEAIAQPCLAGFAGSAVYPATEAYHRMLLAFGGEPAQGFDLARKAKRAAGFVAVDTLKMAAKLIAPGLLLTVDTTREFFKTRIDEEVGKLVQAEAAREKLAQLGVTSGLLRRGLDAVESLMRDCLTALDESADNLNLQMIDASIMLAEMYDPDAG